MKRGRPWRRLFGPHPDQEVEEELTFHIEQRTRDYIARGMSPEAAREAAAKRFGDTAPVSEACTSMLAADRLLRAPHLRRHLLADMKLGLRMFAIIRPCRSRRPSASLAVTIGGLLRVHQVLLDSPLPFADGRGRVVADSGAVRHVALRVPDTGDTDRASEHDFVQWRGTVKSVESSRVLR